MRRLTLPALFPALFLTLLAAEPAFAYVGPGSSLGAVGVVFGLIGAIILSLVSFIWYPVKRLHRKLFRRPATRHPRARIVSRGKRLS
ncbi:hypothetical protein LWE61_05345 [Sphingobium sufflavum]|uniref:hypothetical protein n=1 Tax=Sphingobium sufflavum TaxID=1129547 RepID=UPI001F2D498A|nr:hypothetical protein [Sphingobium sufflavum]MCE7795985.1 hypothetical protein [Sphingobium sufflavum]